VGALARDLGAGGPRLIRSGRGTFVAVPGLPHSEAGDGPPLLLLHAGIADRRMWDEHLEPLAAAGYRAVALDLPGFGEAPAGAEPVAHWLDVLATMDALGIDRASMVGNSFGAAVALRVAATAPERVRSLLLFSAPAVPEPDPSPELLGIWEAEEEALEAGDVEKSVAAVVSAWVRPGAPDGVRDRIAAMQRGNYESRGSDQAEWAADPLEEDPGLLAAVDCPVLVAAGEEDVVDFKHAVRELGASLAGAETALIPACGHLAPLEAPEELRRLVIERLS
jgi:pimeloyl-ACP methyl ester carboxylesterase